MTGNLEFQYPWLLGLLAFQARELANELGFKGKVAVEAGKMMHGRIPVEEVALEHLPF